MTYVRNPYDFGNKAQAYGQLTQQLRALLDGERDLIVNAANTSALLFDALPDVNWAGFYFLRADELVVGPFQGKPACSRIPRGRGVCGKAVADARTVIVADVHTFPDHIACDSASRSEIVIPLTSSDRTFGVLDIDSPALGRFSEEDARGLEAVVDSFMAATDWASCGRAMFQ